MSRVERFEHAEAFSRTVGWVTEDELRALRGKRVAIGGLGGVGGAHLMTLTRLGVGAFAIADPDTFELTNLNRQVGASMSTIGRSKAEVMAELARDVNPALELSVFGEGVTADNVDAFLDGCELYVDGLDLFAMDERRLVFARCEARGIPAITAGPLGMSAALMTFAPTGMPFEDYFQLEGHRFEDQVVRFVVGLAPAALQRSAMVIPSAFDVRARHAPSNPMGMQLCAGAAGTEALKHLLGRGPRRLAPWSFQVDAYSGRARWIRRRWGNRGPFQRIALRFATKAILSDASRQLPSGG